MCRKDEKKTALYKESYNYGGKWNLEALKRRYTYSPKEIIMGT
jgi:hypothetical protein